MKNREIFENHQKKFIQIAAGHSHIILLAKTGEIYAFGSNFKKQCSVDDTDFVSDLREITNLQGCCAKAIFAGGAHSAVLTVDSQFFVWGDNRFGQLGLDNSKRIFNSPVEINSIYDIKIKSVHFGGSHAILMDENNDISGVGNGAFGQIGSHASKMSDEITSIEELKDQNIQAIAVGSRHTLGCSERKVFILGSGSTINQVISSTESKYQNIFNYDMNIKQNEHYVSQIFSNFSHSFAILTTDREQYEMSYSRISNTPATMVLDSIMIKNLVSQENRVFSNI
ncbi:MAG: E3 ISG15--protein ligase herc5, partial [Paramarteilia canceri]